MSVVVVYPVEVKSYRVSVNRNTADIMLDGVEMPEQGAGGAPPEIRRVGRISFGNPDPISDDDFITRGGFLAMDRPLAMFAGILDLLRNEKPLFLHDDGTLSTELEPAGEGEDAAA